MTFPFVPADPEPAPVAFHAAEAASTGIPTPPPAPVVQPPTRPQAARGGSRLAPVLAAAVLSAVLAAGGTAALVQALRPVAPAATVTTLGSTATTTSATTVTGKDLTDVIAEARKSVVTITVDGVSADRFSPFGGTTSGIGSGIIISTDG